MALNSVRIIAFKNEIARALSGMKVFHMWKTLNIYGKPCAKRFKNAERGARSRRQIIKSNGRSQAFAHDGANERHVIALPLVLAAQLHSLFSPVAMKRRRAKIIEHEAFASAENLHALF